MYYGAIEAGGTKFVCAVSNDKFEIVERVSIPTTIPEETMEEVYKFFDAYSLTSIGIGSFGPIDVNKDSDTYGFVTTTPKKGWNYFDFLGSIKERYQVPVAWTTDVNAAAFGEYKKGSAQGSNSCLYLTVGTGIGGGAVVDGNILEGFGHPEMGHLLIRKHPEDNYKGACPYHEGCLEGLASGPAIEGRYNKKGHELASEDKVWEIQAYYLAQALVDYTLILRSEKIILGGGVMKQKQLFPLIREAFSKQMNNYVETPELSQYIVDPGLGDDAGITGCLLLAGEAAL
ncbi:ROK family protein [Aquibacillus albus]|uniref:fructokinase n=1 Tax=Aquibacillus albus TaxID=1168171 RepID=A0ABS2N0I5_9BACI|nr:ROK family protein [Aquibacillus albus]MBM7571657.1 fructokinase [Aquibacillus albus]